MTDSHERLQRIDLWQTATDPHLGRATTPDYQHLVAPEDSARALQLRSDHDRSRFLTRRGFMRFVLAHYVDRDPRALTVGRRCNHCDNPNHGKPHLVEHPTIEFSASATRDLVVVAVSMQGPIGLDVETSIDVPDDDLPDLAKSAFTPGEARYLGLNDATMTRAEFTAAFAAKEALGKADGRGLLVDITTIADRWTVTAMSVTDTTCGALASVGVPQVVERSSDIECSD